MAKNEWDDYDAQREAYENQPQKKTRGYESRRIAERVTTTDPEPEPLDSELTQVAPDHDALMKRAG